MQVGVVGIFAILPANVQFFGLCKRMGKEEDLYGALVLKELDTYAGVEVGL